MIFVTLMRQEILRGFVPGNGPKKVDRPGDQGSLSPRCRNSPVISIEAMVYLLKMVIF